ncbi:Metallo-dependent phosphatase [Pluteus cervinus]|uniref:Metallo-dependent phosphatase n=1 Tax=Pluteus cervinus TaxID=181527 RepID=A0ACD3BBL6_9AGAR|nr:Metallo-dependent phosphatase [Pluteus cervinus]
MVDSTNSGNKVLKIVHFNDVYKITRRINGQKEPRVTKFATLLTSVREKWNDPADSLTLFSGDAFSPSRQSSTTRGRHMMEVLKALKVDVSVAGNHEFDFGYNRVKQLITPDTFPWLLSNITDNNTGAVPEPFEPFHVIERSKVCIGFIGLVEKDWTQAISGWPNYLEWRDMVSVGIELSRILRDRAGPYKCDLVIALTHSRFQDDIKVAEALYALSPEAQTKTDVASQHGVDLILGGHDHVYWISKGLGSWKGYDIHQAVRGTETDRGNTLIVKSGADFEELSEMTLTLKDTPPGSIRTKIIESIEGIRHVFTPDLAIDTTMDALVQGVEDKVTTAEAMVICVSEVDLDARPQIIRTGESVIGNWIADCLKPAYDDVLERRVDGVIQCAGSIRGECIFPKGNITGGDLNEMFPYPDPMVVIEMTGAALWAAMNHGLGNWPKHDGRFPAISGFRVEWKSSIELKSGELYPPPRVQKIWLQRESKGPDGKPKLVEEEIQNTLERTYIISIPEFMLNKGDGYDFSGQKLILSGEHGKPKTTLISQFLRGAHYVTKALKLNDPDANHQLPETANFLSEAERLNQSSLISEASRPSVQNRAAQNLAFKMDSDDVDASENPVMDIVKLVQQITTPSEWIALALKVAAYEDLSMVDPYEEVERQMSTNAAAGTAYYKRAVDEEEDEVVPVLADDALWHISPVIDGRLKDLDNGVPT